VNLSKETKENIGKANKGKLVGDKNPAKRPEVRRAISNTPRTEEWSGKIGKALKGRESPLRDRHLPEKHRTKIGDAQRGEKNHRWKGGKKTVRCGVCGRNFKVKPSRLRKGEGRYCSMDCYHKTREGENHPG
jgi:hypothetical protein